MIISQQQDVLSSPDTLMKKDTALGFASSYLGVSKSICVPVAGGSLYCQSKTGKDNNLEKNPPNFVKKYKIKTVLIGSLELALHLPSIHYCLLSKHKTI